MNVEEEDMRLGDLVDSIVLEVLGQRATPGCPTLAKKEALAVLSFIRSSKNLATLAIEGGKDGHK
jgi:hypothetical protein